MTVALVGPDGAQYTVDESELDAALRQGFKMPTAPLESQAQTTGEKLLEAGAEATDIAGTTAASGLSGLTAGLSDVALAKSSPEARQVVEAQREAHPVANVVGQLAGAVASPVGEVANLVRAPLMGASALGRVGARAAGDAAAGLLFGAGNAMSEAALGDTELTAEKLLVGAGLGGLLGGVGGGVVGAIGEGASAAMPGIRKLASRATTALDDIANDATISSTRAQQNVINKIGDERLPQVARVLRDRGHLQMSPEAIAESVAKDREQVGKLLGKFLDDADAVGSKADHMRLLGRLDDFEAKLNPLERDAIAGDLRSARKAVAQLGEEGSGFRALDDLKQTIQAKAKFSRGPTPLDDTTLGLKRNLAGVFRDELDQQLLPQLGSDGARAFTESKATYGALKDAERLAQSGMGRVGERGALGYIGLKDLMAGAALGGAGGPFGVVGAIGSKVMREHGAAIVARIADKLAKEPALQTMAQSFAAALPQTLPKLGAYGERIALAAEQSPQHALATHMAMAQLEPEYAATAQLAGLTPEQPDQHHAALGRAQSLAEMQAAAKAQDDEMRRAVDKVFKGGGSAPASPMGSQDFGSKRMRQPSGEGYNRRVDEIRRFATDPQALMERVSGNLGPVAQLAPGIAAQMSATASRAVAYLAKQAEVPPKTGPLAHEWDPPEADRFAFEQKLAVVQEPMSVLKFAAAGELTEDQVEAMKAVYPRFADEVTMLALEKMAEGPARVPYEARLMLQMLTGVDPDGTFSPEAIAGNQAAITASAAREAKGAQGSSKAKDVTLAERTATPQQRTEVRDEA